MQTEIDSFSPKTRQQWREWLEEYHDKKQSVWLLYPKKQSNQSGVRYSEAVEEALCYGWIDSKAKAIDDQYYMQFFSRRKPASGWSKVNKERIGRLIEAGLMAPAGFASIERAKQNGSWILLDEVEALTVPADLEDALQKKPTAHAYFTNLSRSDKRAVLQWLAFAKRAATRQSRLAEFIERADQQQKPKLLQWTKKKPTGDE